MNAEHSKLSEIVSSDLTESTGSALRQSEEKYRVLFESIDEGFCICEMLFDEQGQPYDYRFLEFNRVFEQMTGLEEAANRTIRELVPDIEQFWIETYGKVVKTRAPIKFESQSIALNRWFDVNAFPFGKPEEHQFAVLFTNITERKIVERERDRFLAVGSDLQMTVDTNGCFKWVSPTFERSLGWTVGEMTARPWIDFIHPDDVELSISKAYSVAPTGDTHSFENRCRHKDGSYRWFLWTTEFYVGEQTVYGAAVDITERVQVEEERIQTETALRHSEEQSRNILESIAEAFFSLDENWQFTHLNQAALALLDRTLDDLIGRNFWEEYPGVIGSEIEPSYRQAMNDRISSSGTIFYPDHDRWYEVRTYPAEKGITVYFSNVTEQINAQESLRASEVRFRRIFESNMIGMGVWKKAGGVSDANEALLDMIGYSRSDLEAGLINWYALTPDEHRWKDDQALAEIAMHGSCRSYEKEYLHQQGHRVPVVIGGGSFTPTAETGVFFALDLTQRRAAEIEREQLLKQEQTAREAAEQANRIKDEFLAVLSHELRSPLNPILGWTRLLRNGKLDDNRKADALATIERNAKLQSQLIEDLLDISRIMQGKLTLNAAPTNLAAVTKAAIETVQLAADAKNIRIILDFDSTLLPISGDAARLQQVVWNLLTNAVKFTPSGGAITAELRQVNQRAQLRIIDTGKGIQAKFLPHVFEYFRQEDGSTTRRFGGLGLGLAIVRQIIEMHGGSVWAESEGEDKGTTFTVQLPTVQQALPEPPEVVRSQINPHLPLDNVQILLVDDDADTREFQVFLLQESGAIVTSAASGAEALEKLENALPHIIVSDIGMANMDGYMLIQQIRARPPNQGGTIPAIALTAYAAEIDQKKALQAGFQLHLTKPLDPEQVVKSILSLLSSNSL